MPRFLGLVLAVLAGALFFALTAGGALASHVACGDVIAQDTTLDSDLTDCPGDGLVIGADNITLDLNGHVIDGISTSSFHGARGVVGTTTELCPSGCSRGVTIENGSIQQFTLGIELNSLRPPIAAPGAIRRLTIFDTQLAMEVSADHMRIERNSIDSAMALSDSVGMVIERNRVSNGGIGIAGGEKARVLRNWVSGARFGIRVSDSADHVLIRNIISGNGVGIEATSSAYRMRIERNLVQANAEDGVRVDCCGSRIVGNVVHGNGDDGIDVALGDEGYGPNVVARNVARYNTDFGIVAEAGVIDGGHNRAFGNGNPSQCLNIVCR
jgi:parallel beta-helix repeat protein